MSHHMDRGQYGAFALLPQSDIYSMKALVDVNN